MQNAQIRAVTNKKFLPNNKIINRTLAAALPTEMRIRDDQAYRDKVFNQNQQNFEFNKQLGLLDLAERRKDAKRREKDANVQKWLGLGNVAAGTGLGFAKTATDAGWLNESAPAIENTGGLLDSLNKSNDLWNGAESVDWKKFIPNESDWSSGLDNFGVGDLYSGLDNFDIFGSDSGDAGLLDTISNAYADWEIDF